MICNCQVMKPYRKKQADLESLKEAKHQVTERGRLKKQQAAQILTDGGFSAEADFLKEFAEQQNRLNELENNLQDLQTKTGISCLYSPVGRKS